MLIRVTLKTAYKVRKEAEGEEEESSDEDDDGDDSDLEDGEALDTDEDDIDEDSAMYLESLQEKINKHSNGTVTVRTLLVNTYLHGKGVFCHDCLKRQLGCSNAIV